MFWIRAVERICERYNNQIPERMPDMQTGERMFLREREKIEQKKKRKRRVFFAFFCVLLIVLVFRIKISMHSNASVYAYMMCHHILHSIHVALIHSRYTSKPLQQPYTKIYWMPCFVYFKNLISLNLWQRLFGYIIFCCCCSRSFFRVLFCVGRCYCWRHCPILWCVCVWMPFAFHVRANNFFL